MAEAGTYSLLVERLERRSRGVPSQRTPATAAQLPVVLMPRASSSPAGVGASAPLLGPCDLVEPIPGPQLLDSGRAQLKGHSRPASPDLLVQAANSEIGPAAAAGGGAEDRGRAAGGSAASSSADHQTIISRRRRALLALALSLALIAPVALPLSVHWAFEAGATGEICPFRFNLAAQTKIEKLLEMTDEQRVSALDKGMDKATVLQLLRDADTSSTETWIASAPITLRNSFVFWLAAKLFFAAADIQQRGLLGMAVSGHGARTSVVGDSTARAAGWLAAAGDTHSVDLLTVVKIWGPGMLAGFVGGFVGALGSLDVGVPTGALIFALPAFYARVWQIPACAQQQQQQQATWEEARADLGLTRRQAIGLSVIKFFLWHWSQPVAYLLVFGRYFGCTDFMNESQQAVGSIVAAREVAYMISTAVALRACPVYLLLDVRTVLNEAETQNEGRYRVLAYLTMPHNFVSLCLANCSMELRLVFLPVALCQIIADFASCFALGPLLLSSTPSPGPLKIGYFITSSSFVFFFRAAYGAFTDADSARQGG